MPSSTDYSGFAYQGRSQGDNTSAFLDAVNDSPGSSCKLVWGQEGEVSNYDEGDSPLIDDIKISLIQ